uniref:Putative zinc-finger domain-containing protein n=1 Tax=candidate division WOR-3 bacterium TaxID=2052148 RepID=A0A7C4TH11_UNCW3
MKPNNLENTPKRKEHDLPIELLSAYLDNELNEKDRNLVKEHLLVCRECAKKIEEFKTIDGYLKERKIPEPSSDFVFNLNKRVMASIKKSEHPHFLSWLSVLVPAVAVFLFIILFYEKPIKIVGMEYRVGWEEIKTEEKELAVEISLPKDGVSKLTQTSYSQMRDKLSSVGEEEKPMTEVSKMAGKEPPSEELKPSRKRIVRAIIDSTGQVVGVATGGSIAPKRDTLLENYLKGKYLARPSIKGKATKLFVEFSENEEDSSK